jgi:hypothetical protein
MHIYFKLHFTQKNGYNVFQLFNDYLFYWTNRKALNKVFITQILFRLINIKYLSWNPDTLHVNTSAKIYFPLYWFSYVQHKRTNLCKLLYFVGTLQIRKNTKHVFQIWLKLSPNMARKGNIYKPAIPNC